MSAHTLRYPSLDRSSHSLVLDDDARSYLLRSMVRDVDDRPEAKFAVGDVIESPYGLREVTRMYCRLNDRYQDEWRYETKLVTDGTIDCVYTRDWRTFKESQLVEWNPWGPYVEVAPVAIRVVTPMVAPIMLKDNAIVAPIDHQKLLTGNTMDTLLLPAQIDDLRCVAWGILEWLGGGA